MYNGLPGEASGLFIDTVATQFCDPGEADKLGYLCVGMLVVEIVNPLGQGL